MELDAGERLRVGKSGVKALDHGAKLVTIDSRDSNLARYTDDWLRPTPGTETAILGFLVRGSGAGRVDAPLISGGCWLFWFRIKRGRV